MRFVISSRIVRPVTSPSERANIQSVAEFYRLLKEIITRLAN